MCIIIDANCKGDYLNGKDYLKPVAKWIQGGGKVAYAPTKKFKGELDGKFIDRLKLLGGSGRLKEVDATKVKKEQAKLEKRDDLKSDDLHILALALVAKTKVLVSRDRNLGKDFKNRSLIRGGSIYKRAGHKRLLTNSCCP